MSKSLVAGQGQLPQLVVLGSPRCGTTSLAHYLRAAGLGVGEKDSFYLMDKDAGLRGPTHIGTHGLDGYRRLFMGCRQPVVEVTAGYLYQRTAVDFFATWERPPRFAVVVRDPVERLRSVYHYFRGNLGILPSDLTFDDYVTQLKHGTVAVADATVADALSQGRYVDHLLPWTERFGEDALQVIAFADLSQRPAEVVRRLSASVSHEPTIDLGAYEFQARNQSHTPGSPLVRAATGVARRLMPSGQLRAWGGEQLRRWQAGGRSAEPDSSVSSGAEAFLIEYYRAANARLSERFGVEVGAA